VTPPRAKRDCLAHRIAQLRQQLGLTQAAFAHRIGVSRAMVGAYEAGTMAPWATTLDRIAVVGSVTADRLLRGDRLLDDIGSFVFRIHGLRSRLRRLIRGSQFS
jgi:transcriptional regulator with XRE-family HTH domain